MSTDKGGDRDEHRDLRGRHRDAYDRAGRGPALILIDAAAHYRAFSSFAGLVDRLAEHFTVFHVDRRGRGESTDGPPYSVQREIEDIAALIERAGGSAYLFGLRNTPSRPS